MEIEQTENGQWIVVNRDGKRVAGPYDTREEAEQWIKDHPEPPRPKMR